MARTHAVQPSGDILLRYGRLLAKVPHCFAKFTKSVTSVFANDSSDLAPHIVRMI